MSAIRKSIPSGQSDKGAPKTASSRRGAGSSRNRRVRQETVTAEERQRLIAEAAYFKAERRGFACGGELADWIEAEAEIDALLGAAAASRA
ncbi:MAG TPA: DUF2934 domain-containing protein [Candidatus Desulfobacillus sp.]|nr:DUF2934 domain-containing protein [Candidatus Desulfobacillus sp.]